MLIGTAGVKPMPQDLDSAADYLSLYMVARAGYSVEGAHAFWQRLATQYPASVLNGYTANHPAVAYRLQVIDKTVSEIRSKRQTSAGSLRSAP
jgi:predicted Zn-dependent protease